MNHLMLRILKRAAKFEKSTKKRILRSSVATAGIWFVDIPRTGSTSIKYDLVRRFGPCYGKNFHREEHDKDGKRAAGRHTFVEAHATAREIVKAVGPRVFDSVYSFSFVRHPLDRFYSIFHFRRMAGDIDPAMSFKRYACSLATPRFRDPNSPFYKRPYHLSMCDYLLDDNDRLMVDEWFKFEQRNPALGKIHEKTGVVFSGAHHERGKSLESYLEFYDSESAECVSNFYKDDFVYFSYDQAEWPCDEECFP